MFLVAMIQAHPVLWAGPMTSNRCQVLPYRFIFASGQILNGGCYICEVELSATQLDGPSGCIGNFAVAR
jgi:hypothetical protein